MYLFLKNLITCVCPFCLLKISSLKSFPSSIYFLEKKKKLIKRFLFCYVWQEIIVNTLWIYGMNNISFFLICFLGPHSNLFFSISSCSLKTARREYTENEISWHTQWKPLDIVSIMFLFEKRKRIILQNNEILENLIKFHKEAALPGFSMLCMQVGVVKSQFVRKYRWSLFSLMFCNFFFIVQIKILTSHFIVNWIILWSGWCCTFLTWFMLVTVILNLKFLMKTEKSLFLPYEIDAPLCFWNFNALTSFY